jgi:outer membrane lipoprotein carrier protein
MQKSYVSGDPGVVEASGTVYFKRPHLMRWEYERPDRQLIVTSGRRVYIYEMEANQVTVLPRDRFLSSEISRAFFLGRGDLRREFVIDRSCRFKDESQWTLCLRPKREIPQLKALSLTIDPESHLIKRVVVEDKMGGHTVIEFSDIQVDRDMPDALFRFKVPRDAEVFYAH